MFSFRPLWKMLIDKNMTKEQFRKKLQMSSSTIAKMGKGQNISLDVIGKICKELNCQPGDIFEFFSHV